MTDAVRRARAALAFGAVLLAIFVVGPMRMPLPAQLAQALCAMAWGICAVLVPLSPRAVRVVSLVAWIALSAAWIVTLRVRAILALPLLVLWIGAVHPLAKAR